jgi:hypothetical protein
MPPSSTGRQAGDPARLAATPLQGIAEGAMEDPDKRRGLPLTSMASTEIQRSLSPEQQAAFEKARLQASSSECSRILVQVLQYQKGLLRRLGVRTDLEDTEEFWVQMIAAAHVMGVSEEEFWNKTPRELCAVLEHRATELDLLRGRAATPDGRWCTEAEEAATTKPQQSATPKSEGQRRTRGPKRDYETAGKVAVIIDRIAPDGRWRSNLDDILMALDDANVPTPKTWGPKHDYRNWYAAVSADTAARGRHMASEALKHHLKRAKEKPTETIP